MLQRMRKYTKSWVSSLFLGLLALSFGVWGIADIFRGNSDSSVATVGGENIPIEIFQRDYRDATRAATQKGALKPAEARAYGKQVLDGLINQTALDAYVQRYGVKASDDIVSARIRAIPAFIGALGTFDRNQFLRIINQAGFTEESFIDYIRGALQRQQLVGGAAAGLLMPAGYARALFNYLNEARAADYIVLPITAAGPAPIPSDRDLQAYIAAHKAEFSTPEYRDVTFAWIAPADLAPKLKVTDAQLRQQYEAQKAQYVIPEKRQLEQITFPDIASAKAARAKIEGGTTFADLASQRGLKTSDIQIGALTKADLAERGDAVFALPTGGVTQPLKAPVGYALLHVVSVTPGSSKSFETVKDELRKQLTTQLAESKITDISNQYIDENSRGRSLAQSAVRVGMQVGHIPAIDAHGNTPDGQKAAIPADPELLAQMFKAEVGEDGDPFTAKSGASYVVKVAGVQPPKLKPLNAIRAEATAAWQQQQQQKALERKAAELAAEASAQGSLSAAGAAIGTSVQTSGVLHRPSPTVPGQGPFPRALLTKIFSVRAGQAVFGPTGDGKGYMVALVSSVQHPPPTVLQGPGLGRFAGQIGGQAGQDIAAAMASAAREKQGVTINQQAVDRLTGENS